MSERERKLCHQAEMRTDEARSSGVAFAVADVAGTAVGGAAAAAALVTSACGAFAPAACAFAAAAGGDDSAGGGTAVAGMAGGRRSSGDSVGGAGASDGASGGASPVIAESLVRRAPSTALRRKTICREQHRSRDVEMSARHRQGTGEQRGTGLFRGRWVRDPREPRTVFPRA